MQIPIKVIFPLILFILPVLFHRGAGAGRDQHHRGLLRSVTYRGHRVPVA
jgi:hypothetical protein